MLFIAQFPTVSLIEEQSGNFQNACLSVWVIKYST